MRFVNVSSDEFYLRLLLQHVRGPKSFLDLKSVNGITYDTYQEACRARNLLQNDNEAYLCLSEVVVNMSAFQIRETFVMILKWLHPTDPFQLWLDFKKNMMEDITGQNQEINESKCMFELEKLMGLYGMTFKDPIYSKFPKIQDIRPEEHLERLLRENRLITNEDFPQRLEKTLKSFNREQMVVYELMLGTIISKTPKIYFLNGAGGSGKSYICNILTDKLRYLGLVVINVASTGCASILMNNGNTIHTAFKIPIPIFEDSCCNIKMQSSLASFIKLAAVIWIDELILTHRWVIECIDRLCRAVEEDPNLNRHPFAGKTVILSGDFRQGLPIIKRGSEAETINACIKSSELWEKTEVLHLRKNMRVHKHDPEELEFSNLQLEIGNGTLETDEEGCITLPSYITGDVNSIEQLAHFVFGPNFEYIHEPRRSILTLTNADALKINEYVGGHLNGEWNELNSFDCNTEDESDFVIPSDVLHTLTPSGSPPHNLKIKIGSFVMLLRNINPKIGLCNGTILKVDRISYHCVTCTIISGRKPHTGTIVAIPRLRLEIGAEDCGFNFIRVQFPIIPSYAMTITKSQGQSLYQFGVYLPDDIFAHGQLYTAISRATSKHRLKVLSWRGNKVRNVVLKAALL